jgi:hypothetical protein
MFHGSLALLTGASFFRFSTYSDSHKRTTLNLPSPFALVAPASATAAPKATTIADPLTEANVKTKTNLLRRQYPRPRPCPVHHLSASHIFNPRELRQYLRFCRSTKLRLSPSELDRIPTAAEYADYLVWKKQQRARESLHDLFNHCSVFEDLKAHLQSKQNDSSDFIIGETKFMTATKCRHVLHPRTPYPRTSAPKPLDIERCPVCTIAMHLQYMELLTKALNSHGGPVRSRHDVDSINEAVFQAWYCGKLALVQTVYQYEEYAKHEDDFRRRMYWNLCPVKRRQAEESIQSVKSAKEALAMYYTEALNITFEVGTALSHTDKPKRKMGKIGVRFQDGTNFGQGRCQAYYCRKSPRFDGKYLRQRAYEDRDTESDIDEEITSMDDNEDTESECSDEFDEGFLERYPSPDELQYHGRDVRGDIEIDIVDFSFESSTPNSDTMVRGSSIKPDSEDSGTDIEEMEYVKTGAKDVDIEAEESENEDADDSLDEDSSDQGCLDSADDEDIDGVFIVFG